VTANAIKEMREKCQFFGGTKIISTVADGGIRSMSRHEAAISPQEALRLKLDRISAELRAAPAKSRKGWRSG